MNEWMAAAIAVAVAVVLGTVVRSVIANQLGAERRPEPLRASANAVAGLVFSLFVIVGLLVALGIIDPSSLDELPEQVIAFVPKALSAAILLIGGNVAAAFATVALGRALAGTRAATQRRAAATVKVAILGAAALLAAGQLGVNTTILNLAAAALFFSVAASFALLSGLGGRKVSSELAAGRAVRHLVKPGDHVAVGQQAGTVVRVHPTALELALDDGSTALVPHSLFLDAPVRVRRADEG